MFVSLQSGTIDLEEFIGGIALCLHGTVKDKCRLLFHIFNLVCSVFMNKTGNLLVYVIVIIRGFITCRVLGKLTGCKDDFAWLV